MKNKDHAVCDDTNGLILGALTKGTDLMTGLLEACDHFSLESGLVTCIGSLETATFVQPDGTNEQPAYTKYPIVVNGPIEILNATGFLSRDEAGELDLHLHGVIVDKQGQISGGHFLHEGNPVLVTLEFAVQIGESIAAKRHFDPDLGFKVNQFQAKS